MAFHWQTFKTRALTAIVFLVVMLAGLLWNQWSFFILFSIIHFGAWNEYQKLVSKFNPEYKKISSFHRYGIMFGGWSLLLIFTNFELFIAGVALTDVGIWIGLIVAVLLPLIMYLESKNVFLKNIGYSLFGLIYISLPLAFMVGLRNHWDNKFSQLSDTLPLIIIFSLWVNDTMAYIVGSFIGKTPLSKISPKKTWEGTIGGVMLTVIVMCLFSYFTQGLSWEKTAILSAIIAVAGTFGDLFESKLKRMAGVKDSGHIMPGHGGFLDRFDSLLFAAISAWIYIYYIM